MGSGVPQRAAVLGAVWMCLYSLIHLPVEKLRTRAIVACIVAVACGIVFIKCTTLAKSILTSPVQYTGLTYAEFEAFASDGVIDPREGRRIDISKQSSLDGYEFFMRIDLGHDDYEKLLRLRHEALLGSGAAWNPKTSAFEIPDNWPLPKNAPKWWATAIGKRDVKMHTYARQLVDGANARAVASLWVFDFSEQALYVWEWNRQHFRLQQTN
jgi:hypothetical protein